jgi:hypothetical protein
LDKKIIKEAKQFADQHPLADQNLKVTPFVKSMSTGIKVPSDLDYKKEYSDFLIKKYR